jgi:fumarate reductase (CoM/CoB) subunit B
MKKRINRPTDAKSCVHCSICRDNCLFLKKYQIDIGDMKNRKELAYHCFLCGKCTQVCPKGIDGREFILQMRKEEVAQNNNRLLEKGYRMILKEKQNYLFKNYKHPGKSILFPGCNFPSFYPKTTAYLANLLKEKQDIGVIFDCCGKPVAELGMEEKEHHILEKLNRRLKKLEIEEVVMVCPNCYAYLEDKLDLRIVSIYEKLIELGMGNEIDGDIQVFSPCPDRVEKKWIEWMKPYLKGEIRVIEEVQCCGLGGCAGVKEPELAKAMPQQLKSYEHIYTYCGSCAGHLTRNGCAKVSHLLTEILGVNESPNTGNSLMNRIKTKTW